MQVHIRAPENIFTLARALSGVNAPRDPHLSRSVRLLNQFNYCKIVDQKYSLNLSELTIFLRSNVQCAQP